MWFGTTLMMSISKPELIREVLTNIQEFRRPKTHPMLKMFFFGDLSATIESGTPEDDQPCFPHREYKAYAAGIL